MQYSPPDLEGTPSFGENVNSLRGTMFYVCQGSCLCGTVNNRGKVIYCYGDLVPRQGELFSETSTTNGRSTPRDLLAAQLGIWVFGLIALLIVLLLIRKSISSLRKHIEKVTDRLPWYHDDDDLMSNNSTATSPHIHGKDTTMESMCSDLDPDLLSIPPSHGHGSHLEEHENQLQMNKAGWLTKQSGKETNKLKKLRLKGKDYKKGGDALRGKNVIEAYRVKDKELKRTMK